MHSVEWYDSLPHSMNLKGLRLKRSQPVCRDYCGNPTLKMRRPMKTVRQNSQCLVKISTKLVVKTTQERYRLRQLPSLLCVQEASLNQITNTKLKKYTTNEFSRFAVWSYHRETGINIVQQTFGRDKKKRKSPGIRPTRYSSHWPSGKLLHFASETRRSV
jgi:hypothetical protein